MEDVVESGKDKVKKICEVLRKETLEPAMAEAKNVIDEAKAKAKEIIANAHEKAQTMIAKAELEMEKQEKIFQTALHQGARQSVDWLKEEIEERLFNKNLSALIAQSTSTPDVIANMIKAVIKAVEEEGLETDLQAVIPTAVEARSVNELLGKECLEKLKEKSVVIGTQKGGVEIKLLKDNITIDLTESALLDLAIRYVRKDFHQFFFAES